jgi:hypothetical protein
MRSAKEKAITEHRVITSVDCVESRQFDLGSGGGNRCKALETDRIIRTLSVETAGERAERAGHRAASFPGESQIYIGLTRKDVQSSTHQQKKTPFFAGPTLSLEVLLGLFMCPLGVLGKDCPKISPIGNNTVLYCSP